MAENKKKKGKGKWLRRGIIAARQLPILIMDFISVVLVIITIIVITGIEVKYCLLPASTHILSDEPPTSPLRNIPVA